MSANSEWVDAAWALAAEGRFGEAHALFVRICEAQPDDAEAWMMRGATQLELGDTDDAAECLERALALDGDYADPYLHLSKIALASSKLQQALDHCQNAVKRDPDYVEALILLSVVQARHGSYAEAETAARQAQVLAPDNAAALVCLGNALLALGKFEQARENYWRAQKLNPSDAETCVQLGRVSMRLGEGAAAESWYLKALALNPGHADASNLLAGVQLALGKYAEAEHHCRQALQSRPGFAEAHANLGNIFLHQQGRTEQAIFHFRQAVQINPEFVGAWVNLAYVLRQQKQFDEAVAIYQRLLTLAPDYVEARLDMGSAFLEQGELDQALACYEQAAIDDPFSAPAQLNRGYVYKLRGQWTEAAGCFTQAIELAPELADAYYNLGLTQKLMGEFDSAALNLEKAHSLDNKNLDVQSSLSLMCLTLGRFKEGWHHYLARPSMRKSDIPVLSDLPQNLLGKRILLIKDQGIGDEIFFLRFVAALKARGAWIAYRADPKIVSLVGRLDCVDAVVGAESVADIDYSISLGDVPNLLCVGDSTPAPINLPVLAGKRCEVEQQLAIIGAGPYIGVTWWAGTRQAQSGLGERLAFREVPLASLAEALRRIPGKILVLQRDPEMEDIERLQALLGRPVHNFGVLNNDLEAMLALLSLLDDYVGVDNTNMHLATALGKPCRMLVPHPPEWRTGAAGERSVWFPGFKLYRQIPDGDWSPAFSQLKSDLTASFVP